jgi:hypothetical protein
MTSSFDDWKREGRKCRIYLAQFVAGFLLPSSRSPGRRVLSSQLEERASLSIDYGEGGFVLSGFWWVSLREISRKYLGGMSFLALADTVLNGKWGYV